jgi:uncharacterized cofD-like protein
MRIVVIGGGSGSSVALRGLRNRGVSLTSIVTMFDSGGSSGLLRKEFGYPPFGDLRQCLLALSEDSLVNGTLSTALDFRFSGDSSLNGHNVGNLILAALTSARGDLQSAVDEIARLLSVKGRVLPVSLDMADLCAELEDGTAIVGESAIDVPKSRRPAIRKVFLDPDVRASPLVVEAILEADAVVLGPGDLYTSVIPNLLVGGVAQALQETSAALIYVCNLMTKHGETDGFDAADYAAEIVRYAGVERLDWVIANNRQAPPAVLAAYEAEHAAPVAVDESRIRRWARSVMVAPLSNAAGKLRHDDQDLAEALICAVVARPRSASQPNGAAHAPGHEAVRAELD